MSNKTQLHFLILGTGVVGQVYGAYLQRAGHLVTFYTREKYLEGFLKNGIKIHESKKKTIHVKALDLITKVETLTHVDFVLICFRYDQRFEGDRLFQNHDCSKTKLVVCFPLWNKSRLNYSGKFKSAHYLMPGIAALFRGREIYLKFTGTTNICNLLPGSEADSMELCAILTSAGIRSVFEKKFIQKFQSRMAAGLPILLGVSAKKHSVAGFSKDDELMELVFAAQKEMLKLLQATGERVGASGNILRIIPSSILKYVLKTIFFFIPGFYRDMIEIHFKKVHFQNIQLLEELMAFPSSQKIPVENLKKLMTMTLSVGS